VTMLGRLNRGALCLLLVASAICTLPFPSCAAHVARVIDGDTIALDDGTTIRYFGVDSPESRGEQQATELICLGIQRF